MLRKLIALAAIGVLLIGCSSSTDDATRSDGPVAPAQEAPADEAAVPGGAPGGLSGPIIEGRAIALTASVTLDVDDVEVAVRQVTALVQRRGGAVFDANVQLGDEQRAGRAFLTVKLPPAELDAMVSGLAEYGTMVSRTQEAQDVTDQLVDLDSRITTMRASVARVRELLGEAERISDIVTIEAELTWRETELERLLAQQRNLEQRVETSTLDIEIRSVAAAKEDSGDTGILDALADGWEAFVIVLRGIVLVVAYLAPFLVIGALATVITLMVRRRIRREHPTPTE